MNYLNERISFIAVLKRELDRMVSRRIYFASCIVLPLFSIFFMATIFGNGQMENLPVGVVDGDNTATSREIIRMTEAVPTFRITRHYADEAEARADVQRKVFMDTSVFRLVLKQR